MKKMVAATVTAMAAALMSTAVFADDVVVRTSIGSGEVVFTETSEETDVSAGELSELVKDALKNAKELDAFDAFMDAEAGVTLKIDEENQMEFNLSAIGVMDKNGDDGYTSFFYSMDGLGDPQGGSYEAYHWVDDGTHYTAVSDGEEWTVEEEDFISQALEQMSDALDNEQADQINLDENALLPNLYEDEDGNKYYIFLYDKDLAMNTAGSIEGIDLYASMADGILGDNDLQMIVVIDAQTFIPRAVSLNASGASGEIPGELFGAESALEFGSDDLYFTLLMSTDAQTIEIPEEVKNTPVQNDEELDLDLTALLGSLTGSETEG